RIRSGHITEPLLEALLRTHRAPPVQPIRRRTGLCFRGSPGAGRPLRAKLPVRHCAGSRGARLGRSARRWRWPGVRPGPTLSARRRGRRDRRGPVGSPRPNVIVGFDARDWDERARLVVVLKAAVRPTQLLLGGPNDAEALVHLVTLEDEERRQATHRAESGRDGKDLP